MSSSVKHVLRQRSAFTLKEIKDPFSFRVKKKSGHRCSVSIRHQIAIRVAQTDGCLSDRYTYHLVLFNQHHDAIT